MKVGFGKQQKKKTQKKQKKKDKQIKDGDDTMVDAVPTVRPSPEQTDMIDAAELSAKDKQRQRMELKNALKVQVASLKNKRNKLTKLAGNRTERRQLNTELKGLVQEQVSQKKGKGKSKGKQPEQQAAAEEMMAE